MSRFRIMPHGRLQEWVAEEKGYFKDAGLDYEFTGNELIAGPASVATVASAEGVPAEVKRGAFETMEEGRACDISSACHWAVAMAASDDLGRMWGTAYSVTPSAIWVHPDSPIREPEALANVPVGVGYHSGSHFSALQALEKFLSPDEINLQFIGTPPERLQLLLDQKVDSANIFGAGYYVLEQQGFRKLLDTTFMIGFLINGDATDEDLEKYFGALQLAQRDIDAEPELHKHHLLTELRPEFRSLLDVRKCGIGERLVFEPYTREIFERTHRWMLDKGIFLKQLEDDRDFDAAVVS